MYVSLNGDVVSICPDTTLYVCLMFSLLSSDCVRSDDLSMKGLLLAGSFLPSIGHIQHRPIPR
jgi:hypothetical protein